METLQVALGRRSYPIYIGGGLLEQAEELLRPLGVGRWAIVCDDTVAALYGAPLARRTGWPLVTFPAGEGSKSLAEYDRLCRRLVQLGLTRSDGIVALGGGRYTHGECVAAGMMEMLRWQTAHGSDQTAMLARLGTLLERYDLPRRLDLPETAWRQYLLRDKKRSGGEMTIAVLERPGHGVLWSVTPEELLEETRWM